MDCHAQQWRLLCVLNHYFDTATWPRSFRFGPLQRQESDGCPELRLLPTVLRQALQHYVYIYYTTGAFTLEDPHYHITAFGHRNEQGWQGILSLQYHHMPYRILFRNSHCIDWSAEQARLCPPEVRLWSPFYRQYSGRQQAISLVGVHQYLLEQSGDRISIYRSLQWSDDHIDTSQLSALMDIEFYQFSPLQWQPGGFEQYYKLLVPIGTKQLRLTIEDDRWPVQGPVLISFNRFGVVREIIHDNHSIFEQMRELYYYSDRPG